MNTDTTLASPAAPVVIDHPYLLDSIAETPSPEDVSEGDWHRYVITQGPNRIVGYRRGTPQSVRSEVNDLIVQLNARRTVKSGKTHLTIGPSSKSKKTASA